MRNLYLTILLCCMAIASSATTPSVSVLPTTAVICSGNNVGLTASGTGTPALSYTWAPATGLSATTGTVVTAAPTATTTYTVTITDGNGITATSTVLVSVNPVPAPITNIGPGHVGDLLLGCVNFSFRVASGPAGGVWTIGSPSVAGINSYPSSSDSAFGVGLAAGTSVIRYTMPGTGCYATAVVTINPAPVISGTPIVCQGSVIMLSGNLPNPRWGSDGPAAYAHPTSGGVLGLSPGTAPIYMSSASIAWCVASVIVTVNPIPVISGTLNICQGGSTTLTGNVSGGTWVSGSPAKASIGSSSGIVTGLLSGTSEISYVLPVTGCYATAIITVNAAPAAITGTASVYTGATTALADATVGGVWSSSAPATGSVSTGGVVSGLLAGTTKISYTIGGCSATMQVTVINTAPNTWDGSTWSLGAPDGTTDVVISSTVTPTPSTITVHNLTINTGTSLNTGATGNITITGDFVNNGGGLSGTGTVNFNKTGTVALAGDTIAFGGTITVGAGCTLQTNNLLQLLSRATYTGSIGQSAGTISGDVAVQRYNIGKRAFRFYGHPFSTSIALTQLTDVIDITGGTVADGYAHTSSGNASAFWFDASAADTVTVGTNAGWKAFTGPLSATTWARYQMVRVLVRGYKGEGLATGTYTPSATVFQGGGPLNQGTQIITLTKGANSLFVTCGNPYASGVQMSTVTKGANIGANYSVWDPALATRGAYVTNPYTLPYVLPAYSALSTTVNNNTLNTLTFKESDKVSTFSTLSKTTAASQWVELQLADNSMNWDRLLISLDSSAATVQDAGDAKKLSNPDIDFYSLSADDIRLAVDMRPYANGAVIPLGLSAQNLYGRYAIKAGMYGIPAGKKLYLHDKYQDSTMELASGAEYWFNVTTDAASQGEKRFELNMADSTGMAPGQHTTMALYPNPAGSSVTLSYRNIAQAAEVSISNISGQVVYTITVAAGTGSINIPLQQLSAGMYFVKLHGVNANFVSKLIKQ